jgi:predicted dienelactone hydrolase
VRRFLPIVLLLVLVSAVPALARSVGFQELRVANGADRPLVIGVWYPSDAPASDQRLGTFTQLVAPNGPLAPGRTLPLVVMSHGNGGWYGGHYDTAIALARAGFVVAALSHTGDTYDDQSRATRLIDRPRQLHRLIDYMTGEWTAHDRIDAGRIGAFGFSSGGFTALVAIGGTPDLNAIAPHCRAHPGYYDCQLLKRVGGAETVTAPPAEAWTHDPRIRAAVVAAPALGFTFGKPGLQSIHVPVQLWRDLDDHILPNPDYAEAVRAALPEAPEMHLVEKADHFDFLAPCDDRLRDLAPDICRSEPGFDRVAFHETFNAAVTAFFSAHLAP